MRRLAQANRRMRSVRAAAACVLAADIVLLSVGAAGAGSAGSASEVPVRPRPAKPAPSAAVVGLAIAGTLHVWAAQQGSDPALLAATRPAPVSGPGTLIQHPLSTPPVSVPRVAAMIAPMVTTTTLPPKPAPTVTSPAAAPAVAALPLPAPYLRYGSVDMGVDYGAPGGTPLYAMGPGVIIGEGISGFGPNTPILRITGGPLAGKTVYYGHAGPDLVPVGAHVVAGQQISIVGYGIVGISTAPHLEVGFYPLGPNGAGKAMLDYVNSHLK